MLGTHIWLDKKGTAWIDGSKAKVSEVAAVHFAYDWNASHLHQFYMEVHVPATIKRRLRQRGINVPTAQEDGADRLSDALMLDRVGVLDRLIFTMDTDFLAEVVRRQRGGRPFATVLYAHPLGISIGRCIADLALMANVAIPADWREQIIYLPL